MTSGPVAADGGVAVADPLTTADTQPAAPASTIRTTTPRDLLRRLRAPIALVLLLVLTAFGVTYFRQRTTAGALDPVSVSPSGSRALAQLLRDRDVRVSKVDELTEGLASVTVFAPFGAHMTDADVSRLVSLPAGVDVVLVGASGRIDVHGSVVTGFDGSRAEARDPGCAMPAAAIAGRADSGGVGYVVPDGIDVEGCYPAGGTPTLVRIPAGAGAGVTLVGSTRPFTNERLDDEGNAALALGLLDNGKPLVWLMRRPAGTAPAAESRSLTDLLPDGVFWGVLQLVIAAVVAMLWRGRRLGPVVTEPLPVIVRAAEAVEGRGRLYAAAKARGRAAWSVRRGAQGRLRSRLALPADTSSDALVDGVSARTGRAPGDIARLLYGPDPVDDAGLVGLVAAIDHLDSEVRRP